MYLDLVHDREGAPIHLIVNMTDCTRQGHIKSSQMLVKSSTGLEALPCQYSIVTTCFKRKLKKKKSKAI